MKKTYELPIAGTVLSNQPLTGDSSDPIRPIPLSELPTFENLEEGEGGHAVESLEYDIDRGFALVEIDASDAFHTWLAGMIKQLPSIRDQKGWELIRKDV